MLRFNMNAYTLSRHLCSSSDIRIVRIPFINNKNKKFHLVRDLFFFTDPNSVELCSGPYITLGIRDSWSPGEYRYDVN